MPARSHGDHAPAPRGEAGGGALRLCAAAGLQPSGTTTKRPGVTQRLAHENWRVLGKPLVMGLAAWKLNLHGGLTQAGSMQTAITAVEDLRDPAVQEVAYWSCAGSSSRRSAGTSCGRRR